MLRRLVASSTLLAAVALATPARAETTSHATHWYERLSIRGYSQFRMNRLYASSDELKNDLADRSIGPGSTFFIRRARVILYGDIHEHVYVYLQPDFAGAANGDVLNLAQIRDWYTDVAFDSKKELRIRIGQSKLPYGFENMQSSQNRVAFDRTDAMNTAVPGERELGFFLYYAPENVRRRFKQLVDEGFKGSGDYGMAAIGVYNGNGINLKDKNTNKHVVARLTYPFELGGGQTLELGMGGYAGYYRITRGDGVSSYVAGGKNDDFLDVRLHAAVTLYPKPIGFQAEYNIGKGPELDGKIVKDSFLNGGYAMLFARVPTSYGTFRALRTRAVLPWGPKDRDERATHDREGGRGRRRVAGVEAARAHDGVHGERP